MSKKYIICVHASVFVVYLLKQIWLGMTLELISTPVSQRTSLEYCEGVIILNVANVSLEALWLQMVESCISYL